MTGDDEELEMLLGEISHAISSPSVYGGDHRHSGLVIDDRQGYTHHASFVTQNMNGLSHGCGSGSGWGGNVDNGVCDSDGFVKNKYACVSSPVTVSGFGLQSDGSPSSGSSIVSLSRPHFEELKPHLISKEGFCLDFTNANVSNMVDDFSFSRDFSKMYISDEKGGVSLSPTGVRSCESLNGAFPMKFEKWGASDYYRNGFSDCRGVNLSVPREAKFSERMAGSAFSSSDFGNCTVSRQAYRADVPANNNLQMGFALQDVTSSRNRPLSDDASFYGPRNATNPIAAKGSCFSPDMVRLAGLHSYNDENLLPYQPRLPNEGNNVPLHFGVSQGSPQNIAREGSLIIPGIGVNCGTNKNSCSRKYNAKIFHHDESGGVKPIEKWSQDKCMSPKMRFPFALPSKCSSLAEAQGFIYHMAKDQQGCRFLQRMFDEGTSRDVQIIFNEIIEHVVELMMNPFGNYLVQKLLEVCDEEQRTHILLRVTEVPGDLVRISLNIHGTRAVQKLIETLKTRQQSSLIISGLEPGFLALIKDLNGNHVVQKCLTCFPSEDSKFIFVAAARYCVDIARHQHGCCVLQRCISYSTGKYRDNLIAEISANGLLLAQDPFGNYVVQFIMNLRIPWANSKLLSQFEGNYVLLSTQKCSSHVVEKCLRISDDNIRTKIILELLHSTYFEQLLQHPHANYVVQTALRVSEGPLRNSLVKAIESHKALSRNSPFSKRIFSHKLLKR